MELKSRQREQKTSSKPNMTGIPVQMKQDFERRSGLSFEDVRVHYHSAEPAKLGALAFTRGEHVYIGPGQERHLRHELTHVVQQKQGLVTPTGMTGGLPVNNDPELERQAENGVVLPHVRQSSHPVVVQRIPTPGETAAARFSLLVNKDAFTFQDAITYELTQMGMPGSIVDTAKRVCNDASMQTSFHRKIICKEIIKRRSGDIAAERFSETVPENTLTLDDNAITDVLIRNNVPVDIAQEAANVCRNVNLQTPIQRIEICKAIIQASQGDEAAERFSLLVNKNAFTYQDAITYELTRIGVPDDIAQSAATACRGADIQTTDNYVKICEETIKSGYNQLTNGTLGADRIGVQQDTDLRRDLSNALLNVYTNGPNPIIPRNFVGGAPTSNSPIRYVRLNNVLANMVPMFNEGINRMNRLLPPELSLPTVNIDRIFVGAKTPFQHHPYASDARGREEYGFGAGPSQVMHEQGHYVENYLNVNEFANLHNYLYRHTDSNNPDRVSGWNSLAGITINTPTGGAGYNIDFPEMKFQGDISRSIHSGNGLIRFVLFNLVNFFRGQEAVDNFYLQESNSSSTGYASHYKPGTYATEFLSTTAELLSTRRGAEEVITADPARIAMFAYLTNRELYNRTNVKFMQNQQNNRQDRMPVSLNDYLSIIGET